MKKSSKFKIVFLTIVALICLAFDGWYYYILKEAPEKVIAQTYEIGEQLVTKADGTTERHNFCEVNLYDNVFEIKFNYMRDENQTAFYSQGLQFYLNSDSWNFSKTYSNEVKLSENKQGSWNVYQVYQNYAYTKVKYHDINIFEYASADNYKTSLNDTNPIDLDTYFTIQLGSDLYKMKFRGTDIDYDKDLKAGYQAIENVWTDQIALVIPVTTSYYQSFYRCYDVYYFAEKLFNAVQTLSAGNRENIVMQFGDMFDYYKYEGNGRYSDDKVESDAKAKIVADIKSYYQIDINIHKGKMTSASQSLFKTLKGSMNYNENTEIKTGYYIGRVVEELNEKSLELVEINGKNYLTLSDAFIENFKDYKDLIRLNIEIDYDYYSDLDIEIVGLIKITSNGFVIGRTNIPEVEVKYV